MKEFVVGSPFTTETALDDQDEFLIVACDGVSLRLSLQPPLTWCRLRRQSRLTISCGTYARTKLPWT